MKQFSKAELVERITESNDIESKAAASRVLELIIDTITEQVSAGAQVNISGLCSFKPVLQAARSGVALGVPYNTPEKVVVKIKPAEQLKRAVL